MSYRGATTNLHFFWDTNLVELETGTDEEIAKRLTANLTQEERLKWQAGDPTQWTNESLMLVRSYAYNTGPPVELSDDYVEKARPIVRMQARSGRTQVSLVAECLFEIEKAPIMAKITWTAEAQRWLEDTFEYIAADNLLCS